MLADARPGARRFNVTELEAFATCSSIWFVERVISPRSIDAEVDAKLRGSIAHTTLHRFYAGLPKEVGIERVDRHADRGRRPLPPQLLRRGPRRASARSSRTSSAASCKASSGATSSSSSATRREAESPLVPRRFEVSFGTERSSPELQRGLELGGFALSGKIDRIDVDPFSARGIVWDYKSGKTAFSAAKIDSELKLQIPLYMLVLRDLVGIEPLGGLYRALAGDGTRAGCCGRPRATTGSPASSATTTGTRTSSGRRSTGRPSTRAGSWADPRRRRAPRPARRRRLPDLVRPRPDVPGEAAMSTRRERPNQSGAAIEAPGVVFVSAGAGTGKTTVLVERFVKAVCERGLDVDSLLVITYTERAAGELRDRIRARLVEAGRAELARELDAAWISTIHGFCHPAAARPSVRGRDRPALPRPRRRTGARAPARGVRASSDRVLRGRRRGAPGPARDLRGSGAPPDAHRRPRDAPRRGTPAHPRARRAARACRCGARSFERRRASPRGRRRRRARRARATAARALEVLDERTLARAAPRPRRAEGARRARGQLRGGSARRRAGGARRARRTRPRPAPGAARALRRCLPCRQGAASRRSTSRTSSSPRATCCATTPTCASARAGASARSWSTSSRTRTGSSARSSTCSPRAPTARSSSSSATSSSRSTASVTPTSRSSASGASSRAACSR